MGTRLRWPERELYVVDEKGRERERYGINYGATVKVSDGERVPAKTRIAEWDPFTTPILAHDAGRLVYRDLEDGRSVAQQTDELTGRMRMVVIDFKDTDLKPRLVVEIEEDGQRHERYFFRSRQTSSRARNDVQPGDVLAKIPRETGTRTSRVVCPGSLSCSRPASPRKSRSSPRSMAWSPSARTRRASVASS